MAEPNWGLIRSGPVFEGLMQALVFFEDPKAVLFGRPGVDGGQDALSGDGFTVYQAKYNGKESFATALSDAKSELKKIREYRKPAHARYQQWLGVTNWVLVTNAVKNPGDHAKWQKLVPQFKKVGLKASCWSQEGLSKKLLRFPEVQRGYFEGENRTLLSIPEAREKLLDQEHFLQRDTLPVFQGRDEELENFHTFVEGEERFLLVRGPGGTGKSRLLLEGATRSALQHPLQVFWGNIESMSRSSRWFETIVPERRTLLVLDEPNNPSLLKALIEQVSGRAKDWKIVLGVRSLDEPVLQFFDEPQNKRRTVEICLEPLKKEQATSLARSLLDSGPLSEREETFKEKASTYLAERFDGYPVWMTLAVRLLEENSNLNDLPNSVSSLAEKYLDWIHRALPDSEQRFLLKILRWLAVVGTFNIESSDHQAFLIKAASVDHPVSLKQALHKLKLQGLVRTRGARGRLHEIKPDVLRDHILVRWLTAEVGADEPEPSVEATELLNCASNSLLDSRPDKSGTLLLLNTVARTRFYLALGGVEVKLLAPFFQRLNRQAFQDGEFAIRLRLLEALENVAMYCPEETVELFQNIRPAECALCGLSQAQREKTLQQLFRCLNHAGRLTAALPVQESLVEELLELAGAEVGISGSSTSSHQCLRSLLAGGPHYRASYDAAVSNVLTRHLNLIRQGRLKHETALATLSLCGPFLEVERHWDVFIRPEFTFGKVLLDPQHPFWSLRTPVMDALLNLTEARIPDRTLRIRCWKTVAGASRRLIPRRRIPEVKESLLATFRRLRRPLVQAASDFEELLEARETWHCHIRARDKDIDAEIEHLETTFRSHEMSELAVLLLRDRAEFKEWIERITSLARRVADQGMVKTLDTIRSAETILRLRDRAGHGWEYLLKAIGGLATENQLVADFVTQVLADKVDVPESARSLLAAGWYLSGRRSTPDKAGSIVRFLLDSCERDEVGAAIISECLPSGVSSEEFDTLKNAKEYFRADLLPKYLGFLGNAATTDLLGSLEEASSVLQSIDPDQRPAASVEFLKGVCNNTYQTDHLPSEYKEWLLAALSEDREGRIFEQAGHEVSRVFKLCGGLSHAEFYGRFLRSLMPGWTGILGRERITQMVPEGVPSVDLQIEFLNYAREELYEFQLTELLRALDREGTWVPSLLQKQIKNSHTGQLSDSAGLASSYKLGSDPWRRIAQPVLEAGQHLTERKRVALYFDLCPNSWSVSGTFGQVPSYYEEQLQLARDQLANETEECFKPFWEWRLQECLRVYNDEAEEAKEERGE